MNDDLSKRKKIIEIIKETLMSNNYDEKKFKLYFPDFLNESKEQDMKDIPKFIEKCVNGMNLHSKLNNQGLYDYKSYDWSKSNEKISKSIFKWEK
jgi:hypothetical protein